MAKHCEFISASVILFTALVLAATSISVPAQQPGRQLQQVMELALQGRVYEGQVHDTSKPVQGVLVVLYGTHSSLPNQWQRVSRAVTNNQGFYKLVVPQRFNFYSIRVTKPPIYNSVVARSVGGVVRGGSIEYDNNRLQGATRTGNMFWLQRSRDFRPGGVPTPNGIPDLAVSFVDFGFDPSQQFILISVNVFNLGGVVSGMTRLMVGVPSDHRTFVAVPALGPRQNQIIPVRLEIPQHWRGTRKQLLVVVDPDNNVQESNERNNSAWTAPRPIPDFTVIPGPPVTPSTPPFELIIAAAALVVAVSFIRITYRARRRSRWKRQAKEEELQRACTPCTWRCRKIRLELKPSSRKLKYLLVYANQSSTAKVRQIRVEEEIVNDLNKLVKAYRHGATIEKLDSEIQQIALQLLQAIRDWMLGFEDAWDLSVTAHLKGGKVTCEFFLYHCKHRRGRNVWVEKDKWKAKVEDKRDEQFLKISKANISQPEFVDVYARKVIESLVHLVEIA
jgi:hypothetical protein